MHTRRSGYPSDILWTLGIIAALTSTFSSLAAEDVVVKSYDLSSDSLVVRKDTVGSSVFDVVAMPGYATDRSNIGAPELPLRRLLFIIPSTSCLDSVTCEVDEAETLAGPYNPRPIQPPACSVCCPSDFHPPSPYCYSYGYPHGHTENAAECYLANFRLVAIDLRPVLFLSN